MFEFLEGIMSESLTNEKWNSFLKIKIESNYFYQKI